VITLIGEDLAEEGLVFLFNGPVEECESCRFKASCVESLEKGRKYIINNVKDNEQRCPIHDKKTVKVVEVERTDINALIDSKKSFEGSTFVYNPAECDITCVYHDLCFPEGLIPNDKCTISKILEKNLDICAKGLLLTKVSLKN
jgi:uncharacterized protein (UPF0179 family)